MPPPDVSRDLFERRMRRRRAVTCVIAARAALAEGKNLEAVGRLEEACRLDPDALEARLLLEQVRSEEPPELAELVGEAPPGAAGSGKWSHWVAAAIAVGALAALALLRQPGLDESRVTPPRERARPAAATGAPAAAELQPPVQTGSPSSSSADRVPLVIEPAAPPSAASAEPERGPVVRGTETPVGTGGTAGRTGSRADARPSAEDTTALPSAPSKAADRPAPPGPTASPPSDSPSWSRVGGQPPLVSGGSRVAELGAPPAFGAVQHSAGAAGRPAPSAPPMKEAQAGEHAGSSVRAATPAARPADAAPPPSSAAPPPSDAAPAAYHRAEEQEIGRALRLYAEAYERLDASAARRIWPSVDERALARAFAGLQSQGITFERCQTEVNGSQALAVCSGRASYVPKVGPRDALTARRQWTFHLRRAGDNSSQIASAQVQ